MAAQGLEKIESAPGNGMVSEASKPQDLVQVRAADRALRLTKGWGGLGLQREIFRLAKLTKRGISRRDSLIANLPPRGKPRSRRLPQSSAAEPNRPDDSSPPTLIKRPLIGKVWSGYAR
jgi:hypothetical protein